MLHVVTSCSSPAACERGNGVNRRRSLLALAAVAAALLLAPPRARARDAGGALTVAVASNLKPAFDELARAFQAERGVPVKATFGGSGHHHAQLRNGAPFDLFLSADAELPAKVAEAGLADGRPFTYAYGTIVVWVPEGSPLDLAGQGVAALAGPSVRKLAIPNPEIAPYGRAAVAALRAAGVYEAVKERLVLGQNVSQTAQFAQSGNAQAALLPRSLALVPPLSQQGRHVPVPEGTYRPIQQDGVVLKGPRAALARELAAFLTRAAARATLEKYGYGLPPR
jgi:molybdate transport system substrate-binding protein